MSETELTFPDSVVDLWKHFHGEGVLQEEAVVSLWKRIRRLVLKKATDRSCQFGSGSAEDLADDFMTSLVSGSCPDEITAPGTLQMCAGKFWAEKWNPCGKEINDAVRRGLLDLVKEGRLKRSDEGKTIGKGTLFWLADHDPSSKATPEECENVFPKIKMAGIKVRDDRSANKRLLTPTEAKRIVCELLKLLGGHCSVSMQEIMSCALSRTRNVISPFVDQYEENDASDGADTGDTPEEGSGESNASDDVVIGDTPEEGITKQRELDAVQAIAPKNFSDRLEQGMSVNGEGEDGPSGKEEDEAACEIPGQLFDDERFRRRQLEVISRQTAERIWAGVLTIHGDKVFCLYSLPVFFESEKKVPMKDFGPTSTVGVKHLKLKSLLQTELAFVIKNPDDFRFGPGNAVSRITKGLIGRCAENGHIVPL